MKTGAIFFDMDGVLVDVSESYMLTIKKTVAHFTEEYVEDKEIISYKHKGGYNDDWDLTEALLKKKGYTINKKKIIENFQKLFMGDNYDGLVLKEKWLLKEKIIKEIKNKYKTGIITGRIRRNAEFSLNKNDMYKYFDVLITMDETPKEKKKPDPFGILLAMKKLKVRNAIYVGDSVDDIKAALKAGINPVGILNTFYPEDKHRKLLKDNGARIVLKNVNQIMEVIDEVSKN